jgi:hypothetical protein
VQSGANNFSEIAKVAQVWEREKAIVNRGKKM